MGRIPDRWTEYDPLGKRVAGTRFISFKVPLNEGLCRWMPSHLKFTPRILMTKIDSHGLHLGLVIDLTNTSRYYHYKELDADVEYVKIFTEGHAVPSATVQQTFFEAVDKFLYHNAHNERLIGVHCTHGLNRTGYLVCRYMIDRMHFQPQAAIDAFNDARGHSIERENYLDDLLGKSLQCKDSHSDDESVGKFPRLTNNTRHQHIDAGKISRHNSDVSRSSIHQHLLQNTDKHRIWSRSDSRSSASRFCPPDHGFSSSGATVDYQRSWNFQTECDMPSAKSCRHALSCEDDERAAACTLPACHVAATDDWQCLDGWNHGSLMLPLNKVIDQQRRFQPVPNYHPSPTHISQLSDMTFSYSMSFDRCQSDRGQWSGQYAGRPMNGHGCTTQQWDQVSKWMPVSRAQHRYRQSRLHRSHQRRH